MIYEAKREPVEAFKQFYFKIQLTSESISGSVQIAEYSQDHLNEKLTILQVHHTSLHLFILQLHFH